MEINNFNNELNILIEKISVNRFSSAEVEQFKNKIAQLQLNCESDILKKSTTIKDNFFNENEKFVFNRIISVVKNGYFGVIFYNS